MTEPAVGLIANPAAGKDIRRLVAPASTFDNSEKVRIVRRILAGLAAMNIPSVAYLPDAYGIVERALAGMEGPPLSCQPLPVPLQHTAEDTLAATQLLVAAGVRCIVTLGGDGTNRIVAKMCGSVPVVAVATGTNNVFPTMVDGTLAGIAAGLVARGLASPVCIVPTPRLDVLVDGKLAEIALVDVAISAHSFLGARAVWEPELLRELIVAQAAPGVIGLASIGAHLAPGATERGRGLHIVLGPGGLRVQAILAPGLVRPVSVRHWQQLEPGDVVEITELPCTVAVDGERELRVAAGQRLSVQLTMDGPRRVDIRSTLVDAAARGLLRVMP